MRKLTITSVAVGAALLSAAPFSLRFSPENSVSLAIDTVQRGDWSSAHAVEHCGRSSPSHAARVLRLRWRLYPYRSYGYGCGSYSAYQSNTYGYHPYRVTGSWNSYSSTWYSPYRANGGYSSPAYNPWSAYGSTAYSPFPWGGYSSAAYNPYWPSYLRYRGDGVLRALERNRFKLK